MNDTITGALIALSGVVLTLISSHVADVIKAYREKGERKLQRELTLKKELYLPLICAFTEGANLFTRIPNAHHTKLSDLCLSTESQNALAAKNLIANEGVMATTSEAGKQLAQGMMRLMQMKAEEAKLAYDLEFLNTTINDLNAENRNINDRMSALHEAGSLNPDVVNLLNIQFKENNLELQSSFKEQKEKIQERQEILKALHTQSIKELVGMGPVTAAAIIAIRHDLQIPTNDEAIKKEFSDSLENLNENFTEYISEIWKTFELEKMANHEMKADD